MYQGEKCFHYKGQEQVAESTLECIKRTDTLFWLYEAKIMVPWVCGTDGLLRTFCLLSAFQMYWD